MTVARGCGCWAFRLDEVERADAILIGHPPHRHISDAAQIAAQTGASVVVHPLGADLLTKGGRRPAGSLTSGAGAMAIISIPEFTFACSTASIVR